MNRSQKRNYEAPDFQIDTMYLEAVLCTSATTTAWYEDNSYDYNQLD